MALTSAHCGAQAAQYAEGLQKLIPQLGYLAKILPPAVLQWKLELLKQGNAVVKPLLPNIQQRVFLLTADNDLLIPSKQEGTRLKNLLPRCRHKVCLCVCLWVCACVHCVLSWVQAQRDLSEPPLYVMHCQAEAALLSHRRKAA